MSNPASFAEIVDALRQAEAGLEVAVAHKPQTTAFAPSHVLALQIVKGVLARLPVAPTEAAAMAATVPAEMYVETRQCYECCHIGINDSSDTDSACNHCDWTGPNPGKDHCPGCDNDGTMTSACPECGGRYEFLCDARLPRQAPVADQPAEPSPADPLESIEQYRIRMAAISTAALGYWKEGDSIHPDYATPELLDVARLYAKYAALYLAASQAKPDGFESFNANGIAWAVAQWDASVKNRPLQNVHRRTHDDIWRQIIRYFGGDPEKLVGPTHDDLLVAPKGDSNG